MLNMPLQPSNELNEEVHMVRELRENLMDFLSESIAMHCTQRCVLPVSFPVDLLLP